VAIQLRWIASLPLVARNDETLVDRLFYDGWY
jgi:hypothetical protein